MIRKRWVLAGMVVAGALTVLWPRGAEEEEAFRDGGEISGEELAERRGALVDEVVFTREPDAGKMAGLIERGSHQVFAQGVTDITAYHRLRDSRRGEYETSYGSNVELTLNPAKFDDGKLNPFTVREVREAMNWLVNRRHVAEEIFGGMAVPRTLPVNTAFPDYARLAETARSLELYYAHNPERAREVIEREMKELGAERRNGKWFYDDSPVTIRVLIRTEDARNQVGDYVANLMEDLGFEVRRLYRSAEEASRIWIGGDPTAGQWHIYTGSWVSTVVSRDISDDLSYYYTNRGRPEPLWQAYDPDPELDEIASRLERRDYRTMDERQELMERGMELAMGESYRIWLVDQLSIIPRASNVALAADLAGGIAGSRLWPYTLRYRDRLGGRMVFAAPSLLTEPWNPVAGSNWLFDTMITRATSDPPLLPDPFTGLYWPQRIQDAKVTVAGDSPVSRTHDWLSLENVERIEVPGDAWIDWDGENEQLKTVEEAHPDGLEARSRVRIVYEDDFLERRWHDGTRMSRADLFLPWILNYARADENSEFFDPAHVPRFKVTAQHFRGWRIVEEEPLTIEVYSDQILPDAENMVARRAMSPQPWHTLALGMSAEARGDLAFSSHKADAGGVDWMSLVAGPSLSVLKRHLDRATETGWMPWRETLAPELRDRDEIADRWKALGDWHRERQHFWVGNGPFYLHSVHPVESTVVLRRFEDFPDRADKWLDFSEPAIPELELDGPMMVPHGTSARFNLRITFEGEPYPEDEIDAVEYLLFDGGGRLQGRGEAEPAGDGLWTVELDADSLQALGSGANSLELTVTSKQVALPGNVSHAFATVPEGTPMLEDNDD